MTHGAPRKWIWVEDLNRLYRSEPALYEQDFSGEGFEWVDSRDSESSVISFIRKGATTKDILLIAANFTPVPRMNYRLGVPRGGPWRELLNSDAKLYGGSGHGNFGGVDTVPIPCHGRYESISIVLPPLGVVFLKNEAPREPESV